MTPEEQTIVIAEFCGWKVIDHSATYGPMWWISPSGVEKTQCPDYVNDLNAMHSAEESIKGTDNYCKYLERLYAMLTSENQDPGLDPVTLWPLVHATAQQRAEALLRAIGKWL